MDSDSDQRAWRYKNAESLREKEKNEHFDQLDALMSCSVCGGLTSVREVHERLRALKRLIGGLKGLRWTRMQEVIEERR